MFYTETKFVGNYIYNIVTNKNGIKRAYWGRGFEPSKRKPPQNLNFFLTIRAQCDLILLKSYQLSQNGNRINYQHF